MLAPCLPSHCLEYYDHIIQISLLLTHSGHIRQQIDLDRIELLRVQYERKNSNRNREPANGAKLKCPS